MKTKTVGWLCLAAILIHAVNHVRLGTPYDLMWECNIATALLAIGCLSEKPRLVAIPTMWLCFGTPLWALDIFTGGVFMATSLLTHFGALLLGLYATRKLGMPRHTWPLATLGLIGVMLVSRFTTPPELNLNLAHAVWSGWEDTFPRYDVYFVVVVSGFALTFFVVERLFSPHWIPDSVRHDDNA